jgi:hypothetical protein
LDTNLQLSVPAEARSVQIVRSVATGAAAQLPLGIDDIEDLRLAISECCNRMLGTAPPDARLVLEIGTTATELSARVALDRPPGEWPPTEDAAVWSWSLIAGLVPEAEEVVIDGVPSILVRWRLLPDPGR